MRLATNDSPKAGASSKFGLIHQQSGATIIEFAIILPVLLILIFGGLEFFFVLFIRGGVETALHETARRAMTGNLYGQEGDRAELLTKEIDARLKVVLLGDTNYQLTTEVYDTLQATQSGGTQAADVSFGDANQIVRYTVTYDYTYKTPLGALAQGLGESVMIRSTVFLRNEDF